jgi:hypothetical protein
MRLVGAAIVFARRTFARIWLPPPRRLLSSPIKPKWRRPTISKGFLNQLKSSRGNPRHVILAKELQLHRAFAGGGRASKST